MVNTSPVLHEDLGKGPLLLNSFIWVIAACLYGIHVFDLKKAYHCLPQQLLLEIQEEYGISELQFKSKVEP